MPLKGYSNNNSYLSNKIFTNIQFSLFEPYIEFYGNLNDCQSTLLIGNFNNNFCLDTGCNNQNDPLRHILVGNIIVKDGIEFVFTKNGCGSCHKSYNIDNISCAFFDYDEPDTKFVLETLAFSDMTNSNYKLYVYQDLDNLVYQIGGVEFSSEIKSNIIYFGKFFNQRTLLAGVYMVDKKFNRRGLFFALREFGANKEINNIKFVFKEEVNLTWFILTIEDKEQKILLLTDPSTLETD